MWDGYLAAIDDFATTFPEVEAVAVIDRFHVAKNCRDGFETLRKQEMRRLKQVLSPEEYDQLVRGMMWVLRHNHPNLDESRRQRLRPFFEHSPLLHQAYTLREELTAIFNLPLSPEHARLRLNAWIAKVRRSSVSCFDKFLNTLLNHFSAIVNYFQRRANSGFVEGLNNKLKVLTRRCYGIRLLDTLSRRLRLDVGSF